MGALASIVVLLMGPLQGLLNSTCELYSVFGLSSTALKDIWIQCGSPVGVKGEIDYPSVQPH